MRLRYLRDAGTVDAVRALSFAMRDRNPTVKNEAVSALKAIGSEIIVKETPADKAAMEDDRDSPRTTVARRITVVRRRIRRSVTDDDDDNQMMTGGHRAPSQLRVGIQSGNSANIALYKPEASVGGVQFKVGGTQITDVRTTARTEGFLATFDQKSGTVILAGISGQTIAPGNGPVVEIEHSGGRVTISETNHRGKTIG